MTEKSSKADNRLRVVAEPVESGTAAEVARRAGVSVFTVSRVFSNSPVVSKKTRERVLAISAEIGYQPNAAARALRTGKVETLALVLPDRAMEGEFYGGIVSGIQTAITAERLDLLISTAPAAMAPERWMQHLVSTGRCGALAVLMEIYEDTTASALAGLGVPVTLLNHTPDDPAGKVTGVGHVGFDNAMGVQQAVRHLRELGHSKIAYFGCPGGWQDARHREEGFLAGMAEAGLEPGQWLVPCLDPEGSRAGAKAVDLVFSRAEDKPTAIICASDDVTLGTMAGVRRWGKEVPGDISIIGFDDNQWTGYFTPTVTTVRHTGRDLGLAAARELLQRFRNPELQPQVIVLPTQLVVRESTGPPRPEPSSKS